MNQPLTPDERLALEKLIGDGQEAPRGPTPPHSTQDPPLKCDELDVLLRKYSGATTAAPPPGRERGRGGSGNCGTVAPHHPAAPGEDLER